MSSITAADLKLGGRIIAACDAIGAGHLRRAAGIFNEIADDLNGEAEAETGLLSDEVAIHPPAPISQEPPPPRPAVTAQPVDMQSCSRNVHSYSPSDPVSGWRTCATCGTVNVAPPDTNGPYDMGARQ